MPHQWAQLERTGCIDNFRIAAGLLQKPRRGFFYSDSDAHKWAEAAAAVLGQGARDNLAARLAEYTGILEQAMTADGYLFTYNQILFPGTRWKNLLVEHELYTLGHLVEAGVTAAELRGDERLLRLARRGADLAVRDFLGQGPERTCGHQEIRARPAGALPRRD